MSEDTGATSTANIEAEPISRPESQQVEKPTGFWGTIKDQFALGPLISDYFTPVEVNNFW